MKISNLTIIGTSHIAKDSVQKVRESLEEKPDIVAVELDHARLHALLSKEKPGLSPAMIKAMGLTGFAFFAIGGFLQRRLGKLIGTVPGEEMKTAVEMARQSGIRVALIDQPLNVTMSRLSKIRIVEKLRLVKDLILGMAGVEKGAAELKNIDMSKAPSGEFVETAIGIVKKRYPQMHKALVTDRNQYMAHALMHIMKSEPESRIVAVVGAGHEKEIIGLLNARVAKENKG